MANSSLLGGERAPHQPSGRGSNLLGPSDSSDSGSDALGELGPDQLDSDTDRYGTGERASADLRDSGSSADILPDRVDGGRADASDVMPDELAADTDDGIEGEDDEGSDRA
jgi:hypothetical protein